MLQARSNETDYELVEQVLVRIDESIEMIRTMENQATRILSPTKLVRRGVMNARLQKEDSNEIMSKADHILRMSKSISSAVFEANLKYNEVNLLLDLMTDLTRGLLVITEMVSWESLPRR